MARRMPVAWDEEEEDEWVERGFHRGVQHVRAPPYPRGAGDMLAPDVGGYGVTTTSMRRSRSQGHAPAPNVYVYQGNRNESRSPGPRGRRDRDTEEIVDGLDHIAREIHRGRSREPEARGGFRDPSPYYRDMQLELVRERERAEREREIDRERDRYERELAMERDRAENQEALIKTRAEIRRLKERMADEEKESRYKTEEQRWKQRSELDRMKEDLLRKNEEVKHKEERERILAEKDKEDREAKEERRRLRIEWEQKEKEEQEDRQRVVQEYEAKEAKKKKQEKDAAEAAIVAHNKKLADDKKKKEELFAQLKLEEAEKKRKEKEEEEMWKEKLTAKERAAKEEKKKKEQEVEEEMRKKLAKFGFQDNQIQAMIDPKKVETLRPGFAPGNALVPFQSQGPTFIKVHRNHIDIETLRYFGLPWEYDSVDSNYVVILQEMDTRETDILFEHTRKLRRGGTNLLIEDRGRKDNHQYAFVRRRKPSVSPSGRRRASSPKKVGVLGLF